MTQPEKTVEQRLAALEAAVAALKPVDISNDQYADFKIRRCPPRWLESGGPDYTGQPISTTSPEFLDALAGFLTWQAEKDELRNHSYVNGKGETVFPAPFARRDAARARAFAAKMRANAAKGAPPRRPAGPASYENDANDPIPF
ncbi:MAG: hypothetical protein H0U66_01960 [Gemmatimonadaceae bacterium]|nr:hypothetical protein [Gemmatimonadaceae bacterium]